MTKLRRVLYLRSCIVRIARKAQGEPYTLIGLLGTLVAQPVLHIAPNVSLDVSLDLKSNCILRLHCAGAYDPRAVASDLVRMIRTPG